MSFTAMTDGANTVQKRLDHLIATLTEICKVNGKTVATAQSICVINDDEVRVDGIRVIDSNIPRLLLLHQLCKWPSTIPTPTLSTPTDFYKHMQREWAAEIDTAASVLAALLNSAQDVCRAHRETVLC